MRQVFLAGAALLFFGSWALAPSTSVRAEEGDERVVIGIDWKTDLEAARKEAAASNRPLWVTFRCIP